MNEEEKAKVKDLIEKWEKEIAKIKDDNNQPKQGGRLDSGKNGKYTKISKKYQKLIEKRLGKKIWKD